MANPRRHWDIRHCRTGPADNPFQLRLSKPIRVVLQRALRKSAIVSGKPWPVRPVLSAELVLVELAVFYWAGHGVIRVRAVARLPDTPGRPGPWKWRDAEFGMDLGQRLVLGRVDPCAMESLVHARRFVGLIAHPVRHSQHGAGEFRWSAESCKELDDLVYVRQPACT